MEDKLSFAKKVVYNYMGKLDLYAKDGVEWVYPQINQIVSVDYVGSVYRGGSKVATISRIYMGGYMIVLDYNVLQTCLDLFGVKRNGFYFDRSHNNEYYMKYIIKKMLIHKINLYFLKPNEYKLMTEDNCTMIFRYTNMIPKKFENKIELY